MYMHKHQKAICSDTKNENIAGRWSTFSWNVILYCRFDYSFSHWWVLYALLSSALGVCTGKWYDFSEDVHVRLVDLIDCTWGCCSCHSAVESVTIMSIIKSIINFSWSFKIWFWAGKSHLVVPVTITSGNRNMTQSVGQCMFLACLGSTGS